MSQKLPLHRSAKQPADAPPQSATRPPGADRCVLCEGPNDCAVVRGAEHCWCMDLKVPDALVEAARQRGGSPRCICQACISTYHSTHQDAQTSGGADLKTSSSQRTSLSPHDQVPGDERNVETQEVRVREENEPWQRPH